MVFLGSHIWFAVLCSDGVSELVNGVVSMFTREA